MERTARKISLLTLALTFALSTVLGIATILPKQTAVADGTTTSMSVLISDKSDNVVVTPNTTIGDYTGMLVGTSANNAGIKDDWSADINSVFTDDAKITYLLPNMQDYIANGFTVKDVDGNVVLTAVVGSRSWHTNGGYIYVVSGDTISRPHPEWYGTGGYNRYNTPTATRDIKTIGVNSTGDDINGYTYFVAPKHGQNTNVVSNNNADTITTAEGTLTFDYSQDTQTLSVKTTTYAYQSVLDSTTPDKVGNGCEITAGSVVKDLSKGYTITMHNVDSFGSEEDGNLYDFIYSSPVLLRSINGVDTITTELGIDDSVGTISYNGEVNDGDKNVINLNYGYSLDKFNVSASTVVKDTFNNNTLALKPVAGEFEYDDNKEFIADEEITFEFNGVAKDYFVDVVTTTKSINVENLVTAGTNAKISVNKTYAPYNGILVERVDTSIADRTVKINGVFNGNSSVTYGLLGDCLNNAGFGFTIKDINGNVVCTAVNWAVNTWHSANRIYLYDAVNGEYTEPAKNSTTNYQEITVLNTSQGFAAGVSVTPLYSITSFTKTIQGNANKTVKSNVGTLYFDYDATAKTLTVRTTTLQVLDEGWVNDPEIVTVGQVENVDLTNGYTIEAHENSQKLGTAETWGAKSGNILITEINGRSVAGTTIASSEVTGDISYANAEENDIDVAIGAELDKFTVNSVYKLKSLALNVTEEVTATVDTSTLGTKQVVVKDNSGLISETFNVNVKGLLSSLEGIEMGYGASLRLGQKADNSDRGMRFRMNVSEDAQNTIASYIENGVYTGVKYGMLIMPYSYVKTYGAPTVETVFGDNAVYTWYGKTGAGSTAIINLSGETLIDNVFYGAITSFIVNDTTNNVLTKFIGVGYVELTLANGNKEYKVVSMYDTYEEEGVSETNNVRSVYEVAVLAYENDTKLDGEDKKWLLDNYLTPNGYVVAE